MDTQELRKQVETGTTTVGLVCANAVVLGADRKATMGYLVASKSTEKIKQLDDHVGMTIAGLVGDALALERYIKAELRLFKLKEDRRISVHAASQLIANILYGRRYYPYYVQLVVGGYDTAPRLYSLAADGSVIEEQEFYSSGSGSPMAFGVLEHDYKKGMDLETGKKLVADAINAATKRDIASGGDGIDLAVMDVKGFRRIAPDEVRRLLKS
ncbi:MAG: proteasome subunit beta [Candidatus Aenigmarchaeota archaeon]|nr:proteasome subunit beta [Candidatus Aenigmarchaeota archaeon]